MALSAGDDSKARDLPMLFRVLANGTDHKGLEDLMRNNVNKLQGIIRMDGLTTILKSWPKHGHDSETFRSFKSAVVREAVVQSQRCPLKAPDLQLIALSATSERKALERLTELAASPALLESAHKSITSHSQWRQTRALVSGLLGPFFRAGVEVPRLEAMCAVCLLGFLERVTGISDVCGFAALVLEFRTHALWAMPAFVDAFASRIGSVISSSTDLTDAEALRKLCVNLLKVARKTVPVDSGDSELDDWVRFLDTRAAQLSEQSESEPVVTGDVRQHLEQALMQEFGSSIKDALGTRWFDGLLIRSRRVMLYGEEVRCELPRPRAAVRMLAESAQSLLGEAARAKAEALFPEQEESPRKRARIDSDNEPRLTVVAGEDKQMGETLVGTYFACSENHGKPVFGRASEEDDGEPVFLYFCDDRDGEDQAGWWFGPEVGGQEVWAHATECPEGLPPRHGWTMLYSGELDPTFAVKVSRSVVDSTLEDLGRPRSIPREATHASGPSAPQAGEKHAPLKNWLRSLDGGGGELLVYYDVLAAEFDADLSMIAAAKVDEDHDDVLDYVDPSFWETLSVTNPDHKLLFAEGFKNL